MGLTVKIDLFCPDWTVGLRQDAQVLATALATAYPGRFDCRLIVLPEIFYNSDEASDAHVQDIAEGHIAVFLERVFSRPFLKRYACRMLIPNPEWLCTKSETAAKIWADIVVHKTLESHTRLAPILPETQHVHVGFTSPDPQQIVGGYQDFAHFRGKAQFRLSKEILTLWQNTPSLPRLRVQAYGPDTPFSLNRWLNAGNIELFLGYFADQKGYFDALSLSGIHLCTSQVEGFGHVINESRAMAALVIALDAPPMNELVDATTAILIPAEAYGLLRQGVVYRPCAGGLEDAIARALALSEPERAEIGFRARAAYLADRERFNIKIRELFETF